MGTQHKSLVINTYSHENIFMHTNKTLYELIFWNFIFVKVEIYVIPSFKMSQKIIWQSKPCSLLCQVLM